MKWLLVLATGAAFYGGTQILHASKPEQVETGHVRHAESYRLEADGSETCALRRDSARSDGSFVLIVERRCESLLPGITQATMWRETEDGAIMLSRPDGEGVVAFSEADGDGYLSYAPATPLLKLTAQ